MWIMIIKDIPVSKACKPQPLGIYWSRERQITTKEVSDTLQQIPLMIDGGMGDHNVSVEGVCKELDIPFNHFALSSKSRPAKKDYDHLAETHKLEFVEYLRNLSFGLNDDINVYGHSPNKQGLRYVIINDEEVGVYPHECSIMTPEKMEIYLTEGSHTLEFSGVAKGQMEELTKSRKMIYEASLVDGCNEYEATLNALGQKVATGFPPAIGWYKAHPDLVTQFFN